MRITDLFKRFSRTTSIDRALAVRILDVFLLIGFVVVVVLSVYIFLFP